jgi:hypothetical protein
MNDDCSPLPRRVLEIKVTMFVKKTLYTVWKGRDRNQLICLFIRNNPVVQKGCQSCVDGDIHEANARFQE